MDNSDITLNATEASSTEQEFLADALGGFSMNKPSHHDERKPRRDDSPRTCDRPYAVSKNYHASWWSYAISIALVIAVVLALYYLNVDCATVEYRTRYQILTGIILVLAVLHVLISAY